MINSINVFVLMEAGGMGGRGGRANTAHYYVTNAGLM